MASLQSLSKEYILLINLQGPESLHCFIKNLNVMNNCLVFFLLQVSGCLKSRWHLKDISFVFLPASFPRKSSISEQKSRHIIIYFMIRFLNFFIIIISAFFCFADVMVVGVGLCRHKFSYPVTCHFPFIQFIWSFSKYNLAFNGNKFISSSIFPITNMLFIQSFYPEWQGIRRNHALCSAFSTAISPREEFFLFTIYISEQANMISRSSEFV